MKNNFIIITLAILVVVAIVLKIFINVEDTSNTTAQNNVTSETAEQKEEVSEITEQKEEVSEAVEKPSEQKEVVSEAASETTTETNTSANNTAQGGSEAVENKPNSEEQSILKEDVTIEDVLKPEYFADEYFRQLNLSVICKEIYALDDFQREIEVDDYKFFCWHDSVDISHISDDYIAPVLNDGTIYMSTYELTYVYSNDDMTEAFMALMASDRNLRKKIMTSTEYIELVVVYDEYADSAIYDVNPYVYHYIAELIDYTYGDKLFDYDYYCETYPAVAVLHEYNEEALKQHFYSVGLFEGRQGCETFNVDRYTISTTDLGEYMIKYAVSDEAVTYEKTAKDEYQIRLYDPAFEAYVLEVVDLHEDQNFVKELSSNYIQGEINALATYRSRFELNRHDISAHALLYDYRDDVLVPVYGIDWFSENKWTQGYTKNYYEDCTDLFNNIDNVAASNHMYYWYQCEDHYNAAINTKYEYCAQGHPYTHFNPDGIQSIKDKKEGMGAKSFKYYATGFCLYFRHEEVVFLNNFYK